LLALNLLLQHLSQCPHTENVLVCYRAAIFYVNATSATSNQRLSRAVQSYLFRLSDNVASTATMYWLEPIRHASALTLLAARCLSIGHDHAAWMLADRRCRVAPLPQPLDFVLRAELLFRLGDKDAALADIARALENEPDDILANRKMMQWGTAAQRAAAASLLIERDTDPATITAALSTLARTGLSAAARAALIDGSIRGWAAWQGGGPKELLAETTGGLIKVRLEPDPAHRLAPALGSARTFAIAADDKLGTWLGFVTDGSPLRLMRQFNGYVANRTAASATLQRHSSSPHEPHVTVVVPVYGDLAATRTCLESLIAAISGERRTTRILIVDDASPEPGMRDYLQGLAADLMTNPVNLGFVGAVNAALREISCGDVVLLNADTVLPPGVIGRLASVAHAEPGIGTVTPLSNNGELTSLPVPFRENPLPDVKQLQRIDEAAQAIGGTIDLPAGIGFCLYITRACLDATGPLSNRYERGYGEDVHFCLAAREAGFRSVCATSVYAGHVGTRSFKTEKRRLVMRNAARLAARFPAHEHEISAFVAADPLRPVRHAIGARLMSGFAGRIAVASRASFAQATARLVQLASEGRPVLLATCDRDTMVLRTFDRTGALSAETAFELPGDSARLAPLLATLRPDRIEVFSPAALDAIGFRDLAAPLDLHIADPGALAHREDTAGHEAAARWRQLADRADKLLAPDPAAHAFATSNWPHAAAKLGAAPVPAPMSEPPFKARGEPRLGVILLKETTRCRTLVAMLAAAQQTVTGASPAVVVLGATADDLRLLAAGNIMVTGALDTAELAPMAARYKVTHVMLVSQSAHFGSPVGAAAMGMSLPVARFAWSPADVPAACEVLLDPALDDAAVARIVADWMHQDKQPS
jgi:O-antigen biosynthesis protein